MKVNRNDTTTRTMFPLSFLHIRHNEMEIFASRWPCRLLICLSIFPFLNPKLTIKIAVIISSQPILTLWESTQIQAWSTFCKHKKSTCSCVNPKYFHSHFQPNNPTNASLAHPFWWTLPPSIPLIKNMGRRKFPGGQILVASQTPFL